MVPTVLSSFGWVFTVMSRFAFTDLHQCSGKFFCLPDKEFRSMCYFGFGKELALACQLLHVAMQFGLYLRVFRVWHLVSEDSPVFSGSLSC